MAERVEYKFIRLGEGWMYVSKEAQSTYQEVIQEHAREGWRLVQIFAPPIGGAGSGTAKFSSSSWSDRSSRNPRSLLRP